jgi:hypothetical protein
VVVAVAVVGMSDATVDVIVLSGVDVVVVSVVVTAVELVLVVTPVVVLTSCRARSSFFPAAFGPDDPVNPCANAGFSLRTAS